MCGIVAAAAASNIVPVLVEGLKKLEYQGYDSAGIAVISGDGIERVRSVGRSRNYVARCLNRRRRDPGRRGYRAPWRPMEGLKLRSTLKSARPSLLESLNSPVSV